VIVRIGILLVEMPRMVHDVVGNILRVEPDLCVVADGVEAGALMERIEGERPDVVVLWVESGSPPAMCDELLGRFPRLAVVALEDRGERASIYMMRPMRFRLAEISRTQLVTAIRRTARPVSFQASVHEAGAPAPETWHHGVESVGLTSEREAGTLRERRRGDLAS
jgi:DNA-binding NarL/FixJ family response regulator